MTGKSAAILVCVMIVISTMAITGSGTDAGDPATGITPEPDFREYGLGGLWDPQGPRESATTRILSPETMHRDYPRPLPAAVDNSAGLPPVGNQRYQGSCTAWAIGYYHSTYIENRESPFDLTDPNNQVSPAFLYNIANGGEDGGSYMSDVADLLISNGACSMAEKPYYDFDHITWPEEDWIWVSGMKRKAASQNWFDSRDSWGLDYLKTYLASGNTATTGIWVWDNYYDIEGYNNTYSSAEKNGKNWGGHVVTVCGYDDDFPTADGTGALRMVNSWGTGWGDAGYWWLSYEALSDPDICQSGWFMYLESEVDYSPKLVAKTGIDHGFRGDIIRQEGMQIWVRQNDVYLQGISFLRCHYMEQWLGAYIQQHPFPVGKMAFDMSVLMDHVDPSEGYSFTLFLENLGPAGGDILGFEVLNFDLWEGGVNFEAPMAIPPNDYAEVNAYVTPGIFAHYPIRADSDMEMAHQSIGEFWEGNGTPGDPYIIPDYTINGTDNTYCVFISNTSASIVIRGCHLESGRGPANPYYLEAGICLYKARNVALERNTFRYSVFGISLAECHEMAVTGNDITENECGIYVLESSGIQILENMITHHIDTGIYMDSSSGNDIYHNNIIDNAYQAYDSTSLNSWDDGYPSGGNHWSDYAGTDMFSGPGQDQPGADLLGDIPYTNIDGGMGTEDMYPLMEPWTPLTLPPARFEITPDGDTMLSGSNKTFTVTLYDEFGQVTVAEQDVFIELTTNSPTGELYTGPFNGSVNGDVLISFAFDDSKSMSMRYTNDSRTWLEAAKDAALALLNELSDDSVCVSIWDFEENSERRWSGPTELVGGGRLQSDPLNRNGFPRPVIRLGDSYISTINGTVIDGRQYIRDEMNAMDNPTGQTIIWDAVGEAYLDTLWFAPMYPGLKPAVIVLSDGPDARASDQAPLASNRIEGGSDYWCPWDSVAAGQQNYGNFTKGMHYGKYTSDWANPDISTYWLHAGAHGGVIEYNRTGLLHADIEMFTVGLGLEHHANPWEPTLDAYPGDSGDIKYLAPDNLYAHYDPVMPPYGPYFDTDPHLYSEAGTLEYNLWRIANTSGAGYSHAATGDALEGIYAELGRTLSEPTGTFVTIPAGHSSATFGYQDHTPGTWAINGSNPELGGHRVNVTVLPWRYHAPIRINSNADFDRDHGVVNWATADGTESNPWIIAGWNIDGTGHGYSIYIGNTTEHFIVEDCFVHDASGNGNMFFWNAGIGLYNVQNGLVSDNIALSNLYHGIRLYSCSGVTIANNTASLSDWYGIRVHSSHGVTVTGNDVSSNDDIGIHIDSYSSNNTVINNTANFGGWCGMLFFSSSNNLISGNTASMNMQYGIYIASSEGNAVCGNDVNSNGYYGIFIASSDNSTVTDNRAFNNDGAGIHIESSNGNFVAGNNVSSFSPYAIGLFIATFSASVIIENVVSNNQYGIYLWDSTDNQVYHNNLFNNANQAIDNTGLNVWDNGYPSGGNYWSDYAGTDMFSGPGQDMPGSDGIGDMPYAFNANLDNYPLMEPWVPPPLVTFNISLSEGWNLISIPLLMDDTSVQALLSSIAGSWDVAKAYDGLTGTWLSHRAGAGTNTLHTLDRGMGFWLHATGACTLTVTGEEPATTNIMLHAGWNLVGYPSMTEEIVAIVLWGTQASSVEVFDPLSPYLISEAGPMDMMKPGEGYWVKVPADTVWTIDW